MTDTRRRSRPGRRFSGRRCRSRKQWLFVVSGSATAHVAKRKVSLRANSLLLIEKGEAHRIDNTGRRPLVTLNFYVPPAYDPTGDVTLRAKGLAKAVADAVRGE